MARSPLTRVMLLLLGLHLATAGCGTAKSAQAYVDEAVPAIVGPWNAQDLVKRASSELKQETPPERLSGMFREMSGRLGNLKEYETSSGTTTASLWWRQGQITTGSFVSEAVFEKGPAKIEVHVVHRDGGWQISGFNVRPGPPERKTPVIRAPMRIEAGLWVV